MDPEPAAVSRPSKKVEMPSRFSYQGASEEVEDDDPYGLSGPSIALLGLSIAIATFGIPLAAVLTDQPLERKTIVPTALERNGSKSPPPISLTRASKSRGGDSSWKQE